jgi:hypothetical protein
MPEDIPGEERIPALLAEWGAVKHLPGAEEAQAQIEDELSKLGYKGPFETTEPVEVETTAQPKTRRTKT